MLIITLAVFIKRSPAQQHLPLLRITSPLDGTVVAPGETITVVVETAPGAIFKIVGVIGERVGGSGPVYAPPFKFQLKIPVDADRGKIKITAVGSQAPGTDVSSPPVVLNVK